MRLRVYGFAFDKRKAPKRLSTQDVFERLLKNGTLGNGDLTQFRITKTSLPNFRNVNEDWYCGILLKIRDSKTFTSLAGSGQNISIKADTLGQNQSLAEASFLVANAQSGAGLYAHHHLASCFNTGFAPILLSHFKTLQESYIQITNENANLTPATRKTLQKEIRGHLWPVQLCLPKELPALIKAMKSVDKVSIRFKTVDSIHSTFRGCSFQPKYITETFKMPPSASTTEISERVALELDNDTIQRVSVEGIDSTGRDRVFRAQNNPEVFTEFDYDALMADLEIKLDDFDNSLFSAKIMKELASLLQRTEIGEQIEAA